MDKVRILGIAGSPRHPSNSEYLLRVALEAALAIDPESIQTIFYSIKGKKFAPCYSCFDRCRELQGDCTVRDDFQELASLWHQADGIVYSVPIYHMSYPGQLHCFLDRLGNTFGQAYKPPAKGVKAVGAIAQGTHLFSGQEHTVTDLIKHAVLMGCVPVAGDLWEAYLGGGGTTHSSIATDALESLQAQGDPDAEITVKACRSLGRRVAEMALILRAGMIAHQERYRQDPRYKPFFDRLDGSLPEAYRQAE